MYNQWAFKNVSLQGPDSVKISKSMNLHHLKKKEKFSFRPSRLTAGTERLFGRKIALSFASVKMLKRKTSDGTGR